MNIWLSTVLIILLVHCLVEMTASIFNIRALSQELPKEFADIFTPSRYRTSQAYTRALTFLSLFETCSSTLITIVFILMGGLNVLDAWARSLAQDELVIGLLFLGAVFLLLFFMSLPFSLYRTFAIEEHYGFNHTTVQTYFVDILKGALLIFFLGGPLLASILWFFILAGPGGWMFCWLVVAFFSIGIQFLAPLLILPLFNKFSPLEDGLLYTEIMKYAQQEGFCIQGIFTMDGSKRSSKVNAFLTGFGKFKKIVFYDTLIGKLHPQEILAILAHEMGHFKLHHIPKNIVASILQIGGMFFFLSLFLENSTLSHVFGMDTVSVHASIIFFAIFFSPMSLIFSVIFNFISRRHESAADDYAVITTGTIHPLISGLKKLCETNFANLTPHPFMVFLHYSHPPVLERINHLTRSHYI